MLKLTQQKKDIFRPKIILYGLTLQSPIWFNTAEYQLPFQLYVFRNLFVNLFFTFILHNKMCASDSSTTTDQHDCTCLEWQMI